MTERDAAIGDGGSDMSGDDTSRADEPRLEPDDVPATRETPIVRDEEVTLPRQPFQTSRVTRQAARGVPVAVRPVRAPIKVVRRSVAQTAALRESLAEKEAEANELRDSIDQLRQELNAERGQVAPSRRRRGPWVWVLAALVAFILLTWALVRCTATPTTSTTPGTVTPTVIGSASGAASTTGPTASVASTVTAGTTGATVGTTPSGPSAVTSAAASGSGGSGASASASAAAPKIVTTPMAWPGGAVLVPPGVATSGPGVDQPGSDVTYALDADGTSVDAFERVRFGAPTSSLTLAVPALTGLARDLSILQLGVQGLQVELDGEPVAATRSSATAFSAAHASGAGITAATLRYKLTGAVVRLEPAKAGRYAGLLAPLTGTGSLQAGNPVDVKVVGSGIRSLVCPTAGAKVMCGTWTATSASGTLPAGSQPLVQLQIDRSR